MISQPVKNILSFLIRILISALLLAGVFYFMDIDTAEIMSVVKNARWGYLLYALLVLLIVHGIIFYRWVILVRAVDLQLSVFQMARFFLLGLFGNLFLPSAVGGDIIKVVGLCRNSAQKPKIIASVILDRLIGFASIVLVAVVSFFLSYALHQEASLILPLLALALGSTGVALVLFNEKMYGFGCRIFSILPKVQKGLMDVHYDIALLKGKAGEARKTVLMSCVSQSLLAVTYFLTAKALHQDIGMIYFLIFVPLICVSSALPSIGGLGVREVGAVYLFSKVGLASGVAVSLTLMNFVFMMVIGLISGAFYVLTLSSGRIQHHSQSAGVS